MLGVAGDPCFSMRKSCSILEVNCYIDISIQLNYHFRKRKRVSKGRHMVHVRLFIIEFLKATPQIKNTEYLTGF